MMRGFGKRVRGGWEFQWNFDQMEQLCLITLFVWKSVASGSKGWHRTLYGINRHELASLHNG
jgi:hypothetical protein